jgi:hypothetical protein
MNKRPLRLMMEYLCLRKKTFLDQMKAYIIQMSTQYPDYVGVVHSHKFIEIV